MPKVAVVASAILPFFIKYHSLSQRKHRALWYMQHTWLTKYHRRAFTARNMGCLLLSRHLAFNSNLAEMGAADRPNTIIAFLQRCVQRMSGHQLRTTLSRREDSQALLERAFQREFYRVSFDMVPKGGRIDADVNKVRQTCIV